MKCVGLAQTMTLSFCAMVPRSTFRHITTRCFSSFRNDPLVNDNHPSRVAMVGVGAIGGYYGARLWQAGHDVHFLFRTIPVDGLTVKSQTHGDIHIERDQLKAYSDAAEIGPVDWVVVAVKSTALNQIPELIRPLLSPETRVLTIMNGLVDEDLIMRLKAMFREDTDDTKAPLKCCRALFGGLAYIAANRMAPGEITHVSASGLLTAGIASGSVERLQEDRMALEQLWAKSKVSVRYEKSLVRARWEKMLWNLPFNGISVALGGITVDHILHDPDLNALARDIMDEVEKIANADIEANGGDVEPLADEDKQKLMDITGTLGPYQTSTMLDLTLRRPMEVQYLFEKPLQRAKALGVSTPYLETIVRQICYHQRVHRLF